MPSVSQFRFMAPFKLTAISVVALAALAACVEPGGPRPTTPTYSGAPRPNPERPLRPEDPAPSAPVIERYAESRGAYMPRHIPREQASDLKRVAVLLPFNAADATARNYSRALFNAIQMALFERPEYRNVVLMPRDISANDARATAQVAEEAVKDGAIAVLGPLNSQQVAAVAGEAAKIRAPVFTFSTDMSVAGQGAYLVSLTPRSEVERIVAYAASQGVTRLSLFGPDTAYSRAVDTALREEAAKRGAVVFASEFYAAGNPNPQDNARRIAAAIKTENTNFPGKSAVLISESGSQLRIVGSLLRAVVGVSQREVRFLGTGLWNDPEIWRESSLEGSTFPAPDPAQVENFKQRYQAIYGELPPNVAAYGYDAGALAATLASEDRLDAAMIQRPQGFGGVNGLFRFLPDGSPERALAVMQLQGRSGAKQVAEPLKSFAPAIN